jgi:hypothetical protein
MASAVPPEDFYLLSPEISDLQNKGQTPSGIKLHQRGFFFREVVGAGRCPNPGCLSERIGVGLYL